MERRGNVRRNWKRVCFSLLIMPLGFLSVAAFCVLAYFSYEVAVGSRDYCTLWTDIPGRFANFLICYYGAGVCGCLPIPERWRLSWLPEPFFVLWSLQSWRNFFLGLYLLSPLSCVVDRFFRRRMDDSETPLLREGRLYDSPPGLSGAGAVCNQDAARRSPTEAPGINRKSNGSIRTSSADSASQLLEGKDEDFGDSPSAIPKPLRSIAMGDQDKCGIKRPDASRSSKVPFSNSPIAPALPHQPDQNEELFYDCQFDIPKPNPFYFTCEDLPGRAPNRTMDTSQSSDEWLMSFDSPIGGHIVPMVKGKSDKPPYIPDSSISISESSMDTAGTSKDADDNEQGHPKSRKNYAVAAGDQDRVVLMPTDKADTPPRTPDLGVPLPDYPRLPWGMIPPSGVISREAEKIHKRNLQAERREIVKQMKEARQKEMEDLQHGAASAEKESSEEEYSTDSDQFDPQESRPLRISSWPPRRKIHPRGRSRTTPANFSRRRQLIPVHRRSASDRSRQLAEPRMCIAEVDKMKCCEDSPDLQRMLDHLTKTLGALDRSRTAREMPDDGQNVCVEVEEPTGENLNLPDVPSSSPENQQSDKPDVEISVPESDEPKGSRDDSDQSSD